MSLSNHTLILKNDGTLWGCGYNSEGQLGLNDTTNRTTFTKIIINTDDIKSVYCGRYQTFILKNDYVLWGCGSNSYGALGLGNTSNAITFTKNIENADDIKLIYCGAAHNLILKNDGTLWGCGSNYSGKLGLGDETDKTKFIQITTNTNDVKSMYCSGYHSLILKNDGTLWSCGWNSYGQLGLGDGTNRLTFTEITTNTNDIKSVYCGEFYTLILKNDGTLWGCGDNQYGQLGLGDTTNRTIFTEIIANTGNIKSVYCGYQHTLILKNDGTLWGCGNNQYGQLGLGDTTNRTIFTEIAANTGNIKSVYCGNYYTLILKNDGTLWGCGDNQYGQLGLGDTNNRLTFTQITTNIDDIKCFANEYYDIPNIIKIYDLNIGYVETLDTNNFRNIPLNKFEKLKALCIKPANTYLNCLISFDQKSTWKMFNGISWITVSDTSIENIILNGMELGEINKLNKSNLIAGGFTGDLDFKIAMKTNDANKTPSVTKIYIEYK